MWLPVPQPIGLGEFTPSPALLATLGTLWDKENPAQRESINFTDGSTTITRRGAHPRAAISHPITGTFLLKDETQLSAQLRDLITVTLVLGNVLSKGMSIVNVFKDSWAVVNGIAVWFSR